MNFCGSLRREKQLTLQAPEQDTQELEGIVRITGVQVVQRIL